MATFKTQLSGGINHSPNSGQSVPSGTISIPFEEIDQSTSRYSHQVITGAGTSDAVLAMSGLLVGAKLLMIQKPNSSNLRLEITHADGTDQIVNVGRLMIMDTPEKPITGIKYTFTGDFEVFMAEW